MSKIRGRNFSSKDKELLVSIIDDHPKSDLTTNRNNDKDTVVAKKAFWDEVTKQFNSACENGINYNEEQVRNCFRNLAYRAKNAQAEYKKETIKTGGGTNEKTMESIESKVIGVIGNTIKPVDNPFDSESKYFSQAEVFEVDDNDSQHSLAEKSKKTSKKRKYVSSDEQKVFIEKMELEKQVLLQKLINMKKKETLLDMKIKKIQFSLGYEYSFNDGEETLLISSVGVDLDEPK